MLSTCYGSQSARGTSRHSVAEAYSESFQVIHGHLVTEQMQHSILKHASMAIPRELRFYQCTPAENIAKVRRCADLLLAGLGVTKQLHTFYPDFRNSWISFYTRTI